MSRILDLASGNGDLKANFTNTIGTTAAGGVFFWWSPSNASYDGQYIMHLGSGENAAGSTDALYVRLLAGSMYLYNKRNSSAASFSDTFNVTVDSWYPIVIYKPAGTGNSVLRAEDNDGIYSVSPNSSGNAHTAVYDWVKLNAQTSGKYGRYAYVTLFDGECDATMFSNLASGDNPLAVFGNDTIAYYPLTTASLTDDSGNSETALTLTGNFPTDASNPTVDPPPASFTIDNVNTDNEFYRGETDVTVTVSEAITPATATFSGESLTIEGSPSEVTSFDVTIPADINEPYAEDHNGVALSGRSTDTFEVLE